MRGTSRLYVTIAVVALGLVSGLLLTNCSDNNPIVLDTQTEPTSTAAMVLPGTGCKTLDADPGDGSCFLYQDCLEYAYDDDTGILSFVHQNAFFNCCLDSFSVAINLCDNVIKICERQVLNSGGCDCECLYDLDYSLDGVESGIYTVELLDPYHCNMPNRALLKFTVDLAATPSGAFCLKRYFLP